MMMRWVIRAAVSGIVVAILLSFIPLGSVMDAVGRISVWAWLLGVAAFFLGHYLNAIKLRLLLGPAPGLTSACVRAQYAGLVSNLGLPGLAGGDLVRAAYLTPITGLKRVAVASVADRFIDTTTLLVLVAIALPLAGMPAGIERVVENAGLWIGAGALALLAAAMLVLRLPRFQGIAGKLSSAWAALLERRAGLAGAMIISLVVQSAFVLINVWLARQVGVTTAIAAWFVAWPLSKLVAVLPISLGGIGVREAALVSLLAPYGAPRDAVLATGILWQGVFIVTALLGLVATQLLIPAISQPAPKPAASATSGAAPLAKS